jgi:Fe-S cluster assembly ATPase SufC
MYVSGDLLLCYAMARHVLRFFSASVLSMTQQGLSKASQQSELFCCRTPENCLVMITHYKRLLEYIRPDTVHIMADGAIVRSGGFELVEQLEAGGFATVST